MSVLTAAPLPSASEIQQALSDLGLCVSLDTSQELYAGGFLPMIIGAGDEALEAGVEVYRHDAASFAKEHNLRSEKRFGQVVSCRWGASLESCFCGMAVCAAVAKLTSGAIFSDFTGEFMSVDACAAEAKTILAEVMGPETLKLRREWPERLLSIVQEKNANYRINPLVRWPSTEVVLDVDGLFHSHCSYYSSGYMGHTFAVTACLSPTGLAPFFAGSRLGVGGFSDQPVFHMLRKGYEDVIRGFVRRCEAERAPKYLAMLKMAAPTLLQCLDLASRNPELLQADDASKRSAGLAGYPIADVIANHQREWATFDKELPKRIVVFAGDGFAESRWEWSDIEARLKALSAV